MTKRVLTGLAPIDEVTGGMKPGDLWVHCGGVGQLKTTWALNWAAAAVRNCDRVNVKFAGFESSKDDLYVKFLALLAGVSISKVRQRELQENDVGKLAETEVALKKGMPGRFDATSPVSIAKMWDFRGSGAHGFLADMIIVDGAHMVTPERKTASWDRLAEVYRDAKRLAIGADGETPVAVVLLQQTARTAIDGRRGQIEESVLEPADVVTSTWQDESLARSSRVLFRMLKNRHGRVAEPFYASLDSETRRIAYAGELPRPGEDNLLDLV